MSEQKFQSDSALGTPGVADLEAADAGLVASLSRTRSGVQAEVARPDLSILILTRNEQQNVSQLVPKVWKIVAEVGIEAEIVIVDDSSDDTGKTATGLGCRVVRQRGGAYGEAFRQGLESVQGDYVLTIDADHSHEPEFLHHMWALRSSAEVLIGSRYVPAGSAEMPLSRRVLSQILNRVFGSALSLPYRDLSSGYRLYKREVLESVVPLTGRDFDVLQEVLVKAYCNGWRIAEVPIRYRPRNQGRSNAKAVKFARSYLKTLKSLWRLRNGATSCDYDSRAFSSIIVPQRYWQRKRFDIIVDLIKGHGRILDVGCGSSRIIQSLPAMVGMDVNISKLRYLRATNPKLAQASAYMLPFRDGVFSCVLSSEVIEHIPKDDSLFREMNRVLQLGGTLVLGTPDYDSRLWNLIEFVYQMVMPMAYADEHISHYTRRELVETLPRFGFKVISEHYIVGSELIVRAEKVCEAPSG